MICFIMDGKARDLLIKGYNRLPLNRDECKYLLSFNEYSDESLFAYDLFTRFVRENCDNTAHLGIQIGVFTGPCTGNCRFCNFGKDHTKSKSYAMPDEELIGYLDESLKYGDVSMISLMTNHDCPIDMLVHYVELTKEHAPGIMIMINTGDRSLGECMRLKEAGASAAYHVCRMGEGRDTDLDPSARWQTLANFKEAGFIAETCTEPIGAEHSVDEILDNFFRGLEMGLSNGAVAVRIPVFTTPLGGEPIVSVRRYKQMQAVLGLATSWYKGPCLFGTDTGYISGVNGMSAELAASPRDIAAKSEKSMGHDLAWCRRMLFQLGYDKIMLADGTVRKFDVDYLLETGSL